MFDVSKYETPQEGGDTMYMHKLVGLMREKGVSQKAASKFLDVSEVTFRKKIRTEGFTLKQAKLLGEYLEISDPSDLAAVFLQ